MSDNVPTTDANPGPSPAERPFLRETATEGKLLLRQSTSAVAQGAMADKSEGRPPFNEVSVLFPLLTFYTVVYLGLITAEFVLRGAFILPAGLMPVYMIKSQGQVTNREVADALHVSTSSAKRILADLVDWGQIRLMGDGRGAFYVEMNEYVMKQTPNVQRRTSNAQ